MSAKVLTPQQFKDQQKVMGKPIKQWATENNFPYWLVIRVLNGQSKATFGMAHDCAVKMGVKADPALITQE